MINRLQKKYALSEQGAKDLFRAIVYSVLANISLMLPVALLAVVLNCMLPMVLGTEESVSGIGIDTIAGIVILAVIFILHYLQYTESYIGTYKESARRRISLAEKLRTLPLAFFHERDLSDLTSTIMGDCASFEHAFSHTVPQFFGAVISTAIVCIALLIMDWTGNGFSRPIRRRKKYRGKIGGKVLRIGRRQNHVRRRGHCRA